MALAKWLDPPPISADWPRQELWIDGPLPGLNELILASGNKRYHKYAKIKREWGDKIAGAIYDARLEPMARAYLLFEWRERNRRRDPDNLAGGGRKLILDALVACGILPDDGWDEVGGWRDGFTVDRTKPGVHVTLIGGIS
jgi:hypothetical protein